MPIKLEIISRKPENGASQSSKSSKPKLIFVHGICVGAWIWDEYFLPYFADQGYEVYAVSLRGHGDSGGKQNILGWHLADYCDDLDKAVGSVDGPVVVIGHSLGGAVVQEWLRSGALRDRAVGAALLASVPPWGLGYASWHMGLFYPRLFMEIVQMLLRGPRVVNKDVMEKALFSKGVSAQILDKFLYKSSPESLVVSAEVQGLRPFAPMPWAAHPPIFVGGAEDDRFIPSIEVLRTAAYYRVKPVLVKGLAHAVMVDTNWEHMAEALCAWVREL